jgi:hypothetical protein
LTEGIELDEALPSSSEAAVDEAIQQIVEVESELSAPRITSLKATDRARLFETLAAFFLDPGGNGGDPRLRADLESHLGRWTRRKARRLLEERGLTEIADLDHEAWAHELRAIAAARVVDRNGGDLRSVLRAMLALEGVDPGQNSLEGAEIGALAATSEPTRRLLTRIITLLCERLGHAR